jgi:hypothetical protein
VFRKTKTAGKVTSRLNSEEQVLFANEIEEGIRVVNVL